ncbi:hypothetical protein I5A55_002299 [Salmonella enterica]|nr:hypothetical protein [Salmonella enterica]EHC7294714.1 hypothetical protein [Salmonella enterica]
MEIRSVLVLRFAKEIPFVKKTYKSKSPFEFETFFIEEGKRRCATYYGFVGEWKGSRTKALMKCDVLDHGYFTITNGNFNHGRGCPECGNLKKGQARRLDEEYVLAEVKKECDRRGDIEFICFVDGYKNSDERNLKYLCLNGHGELFTSYGCFMEGQGCYECRKKKIANTLKHDEDFVIASLKKECGQRGDCGNPIFVDGYVSTKERNLQIECFHCHESFLTCYETFMRGAGCGKCVESGFNRNKPGYVYIQKITGKVNAGKIGITNRTPEDRMKQHKRLSKLNHEVIFSHYFEDGNKVWEIERLVKSTLKDKMRFVPRELMGDGYTETFSVELLTPLLNEVKSICLR